MQKKTRLVVLLMCMAWLLSLFGCGKVNPLVVDGPGMERKIWSAFTIARCNERFEPIYSYTVKYDEAADEAYLHEGQDEENCIQVRKETVTELLNLDLLSLPDEGPVTGNFLGLTVFDSNGQAYPKRISSALEDEILALLEPYLDQWKEDPYMLDGPEMYHAPWKTFCLTSSGSSAQDIFWFQVTVTDTGALVTGSCRDEDGNEYEEETGIPISGEDLWKLRELELEMLPEEEPWPEDMEQPLDMESIKLTLTHSDGTVKKKSASSTLSIEIYKLLLPYFIQNQM